MVYSIEGPEAGDLARLVWTGGMPVYRLTEESWLADNSTSDQFMSTDYDCEVRVTGLSLNLLTQWFTADGDTAYYNGMLAGYFGSVTGINTDGELEVVFHSLRIKTAVYDWDRVNKQWYFGYNTPGIKVEARDR